jgi:hypothetical protein
MVADEVSMNAMKDQLLDRLSLLVPESRTSELRRLKTGLERLAPVAAGMGGTLYLAAALLQTSFSAPIIGAEIVWGVIGIGLLLRRTWAAWMALLQLPVALAASATARVAGWPGLEGWASTLELPETVLISLLGPSSLAGTALVSWRSLASFAVHALLLAPLLVPDLLRRLEAHRRAAIPADELDLYRTSPFQTLALDPTEANTRAILRRRDELRAMAAAGLDPASHLRGFFRLGIWRNGFARPEVVDRATGFLQSPPERLRRGLLWFHLAGEEPAVRSALAQGELPSAIEAWWQRVREAPDSAPAGRALYNLAIACHLEVLEEERRDPFRTSGLGRLERAWQESLELWARAIANEAWWEMFRQRAVSLADPRINDAFLAGLRAELPSRLLGLNAALARAGDDLGRARYARLHLELVRSNNLPAEARRTAERAFFARCLEGVEVALEPLAGSRRCALEEVDAKQLATRLRKAVATADVYGGRELLARETAGSWRRVHLRVQEDLDGAVAGFRKVDRELWELQQAFVAEWNQVMRQHNLLPLGLNGHTHIHLQMVLNAFREIGKRLPELDGPLVRVRRVAAQARRVHGSLLNLAQPGGDSLVAELRKDLEWARKAPEVTAKEAQMTRDHHQRNVTGMAMSVGTA